MGGEETWGEGGVRWGREKFELTLQFQGLSVAGI